jgi:hypothetical protein
VVNDVSNEIVGRARKNLELTKNALMKNGKSVQALEMIRQGLEGDYEEVKS